ncbi:hypothetical protein GQ602_006328 [Ophiocordyceps camponoti-floridani]|uniref:Uncharacterized protein n=1 Tax=Ophiocordyceps camponoti-floridani TaxID=2030778 RepID=A0A8H4Q325_9HYPO|nr:hypothetical protein GQ602_006328 [Ophiocordyceps camponoti-floridani]
MQIQTARHAGLWLARPWQLTKAGEARVFGKKQAPVGSSGEPTASEKTDRHTCMSCTSPEPLLSGASGGQEVVDALLRFSSKVAVDQFDGRTEAVRRQLRRLATTSPHKMPV